MRFSPLIMHSLFWMEKRFREILGVALSCGNEWMSPVGCKGKYRAPAQTPELMTMRSSRGRFPMLKTTVLGKNSSEAGPMIHQYTNTRDRKKNGSQKVCPNVFVVCARRSRQIL